MSVLSFSHVLAHVSPEGLCRVGLYHVHFTDEEMECQRGKATQQVYVITQDQLQAAFLQPLCAQRCLGCMISKGCTEEGASEG